MRRIPLLLTLVVALAASGLAVASQERAAALPEGASLVPASAPVFVSLNTDLASAQIGQARALLDRFPGKQELLVRVLAELAKNGLDFDRDVRPALGIELDLALLDVRDGGENAVALLKPQDRDKFAAVLRAVNRKAKPGTRLHSILVGDWLVLSDRSSKLLRFRELTRGAKLAEAPRFQAAVASQAPEALARAYVDGRVLGQALKQRLGAVAKQAKRVTVPIAGVSPRRVRVGSFSLYYAAVGGRLVVTDLPAGIAALARPQGARLSADAQYMTARQLAAAPAQTNGFLFVDIPAVVGLAGSYRPLPAEARANLAPRRSLFAYATVEGDRSLGRAFLELG